MLLSDLFPSLYLLDRRLEAMVADNFEIMGDCVVWVLNLRWNLLDCEASDLVQLLSMLVATSLFLGKDDVRVWFLDRKGEFSFKSFYTLLHDAQCRDVGWKYCWNTSVPSRILIFCWLARLQKILMIDRLTCC